MPGERPTQTHTQSHTPLTFWCVSSIYSLRSSASWPALTRFRSPSPFADTRTYTHNHNHIHSSPFGASQACEKCQENALHKDTHTNHIHSSPFGVSQAYTACAPVRPGPHSHASALLPPLTARGGWTGCGGPKQQGQLQCVCVFVCVCVCVCVSVCVCLCAAALPSALINTWQQAS